jgi:hypothetical protein
MTTTCISFSHGASHVDPTQALRLRVCFKFFVCLFCFDLLVFVLCLVLPMSLESAFLIDLRVSPTFIYKNNNHLTSDKYTIHFVYFHLIKKDFCDWSNVDNRLLNRYFPSSWSTQPYKKCLKIPKEWSECVNRNRTDNTMAKRKKKKRK